MKRVLLLTALLGLNSILFSSPLNESFETWPPSEWTLVQGPCSPTNDITRSSTYAYDGTYSARFSSYSSCGSGYDEYLITPQLVVTSGDQTFSFWYRRYSSGSETFRVGWSSTGTNLSTDFTWTADITNASTSWQQYTKTDLPEGTKYVAIHYKSNYAYYLYIDDVVGPEQYVSNDPPNCATNVSPTDAATDVAITATLNWASGGGAPTGYKLYFGTDNPPTNLVNGTDLGDVLTYDPISDLSYSTTYYWKVVPYNTYGDATGCSVWSFTTMDDPTISSFPHTEGFEGAVFPPAGWSVVDNNADNDKWILSTTNPRTGTNCTRIYTDYNSSNDDYLITPPIVLTGNQELKFWVRAHSASEPDEISILLSTTTPTPAAFTTVLMASTPVNTTSYVEHTVDLSSYTGTIYISFTRKNSPADGWYLYLDDILIRDIPASPIISITPSSKDYGTVILGYSSSQEFTITNTGAGTLVIDPAISITGTDANQFILTDTNSYPINLTNNQSAYVNVAFTPTSEGAKTASLTIVDNLTTDNTNNIPLSGTGFDATITSLPHTENFDGVTAPALPLGWFKVGTTGSVSTQTSNNYSSPNCLYMYSSGSTSVAVVSLPPVDLSDIYTKMSFWARANSSVGGILEIGYLTDPEDPGTFVLIQSRTLLTLTYQQYSVNLGLVSGTKTFALRASYTPAYSMLIDDITLDEIQAAPDPAAVVFPLDGITTFNNPLLSWTPAATGDPASGYKVYMDGNNPPTTEVYDGPNTSFQTSGLTLGNTYFWKVVPYNNIGNATGVSTWSFDIVADGYLAESFESVTFPPAGWANPGTWSRSTTTPYHGTASAYKFTTTTENLLRTPMLTMTSSSTIEFFSRTTTSNTSQRIQVQYSSDGSTWNDIGAEISLPSAGPWAQYSVDLSSLDGDDYYLAFAAYYSGSSGSVYLDHVIGPEITPLLPDAVTLVAPANAATNQSITPTLSWTVAATGGVPTGFKIYLDENTDPTTLYDDVAASPYVVTPALSYSTTYYWKVIAYNGLGDGTASAIRSFTTMDDPMLTPPFTQTFDTYPPLNWTETAGLLAAPSTLSGTSSNWTADGFANVGSTGSAKLNIFGTTCDEWMISPPINLGDGSTDYELRFDLALTDFGTTGTPDLNGTDDKFAVIISTDNGTTWTSANTLMLWDNAGSSNVYNDISTTGETIIIDLSAYSGIVKIGFYGESTVSNADNDLFVDNVIVQEPPECDPPTVLTTTSITATSAYLDWTPGGTETSWDVKWGDDGFNPASEGTLISPIATDYYTLTSLVQGTAYDWYVRSDCGSGSTSPWVGPASFTTQSVVALPYEEGFATTSVPTGWSTTGWSIGSVRGVTGNPGNNIYKNLYSSATTGTFTTINVGPVTSSSWLTFDYKLANYSSPYSPPATGSGNFVLFLSTDYGTTYTKIDSVVNNGVAGWQAKQYDISAYDGENIKIKIVGNWISGDYDLAFDNIKVFELVNMSYVSSTTTQNTDDVGQGVSDAQIIGVEIVTYGSLSPIDVTSFTLNTNGSTSASGDITAARMYYTGTSSTFGTTTQFGSDETGPSGAFTINGTQTLAEGTNYFWLVYDISGSASPGNVVDAECNAVVVDGSSEVPTTTAPTGNRLIRAPLSGTKTVGTGGDYLTLTGDGGLFEDINALGLAGNLIASITESLTEPGTHGLNQWTEQGAGTYSVTIQPAASTTPTLSGSYANDALIRLIGASRVTIDGSNSGGTSRDMTISNTSTTFPSVVLVGSVGTTPITDVTIINCVLQNGSNTSSAVVVSDGPSSGEAGYFSDITIQNNDIRKAYIGVYARGGDAGATNGYNLDIGDNLLNSTGADAIRLVGLYCQGIDGLIIENNTVANFESASSENDRGIWLATGCINAEVTGNSVSTLACSATGNAPTGIYVTSGQTNSGIVISENTVSGITTEGSGTACGIYVGSSTEGVSVHHNSVSNIKNTDDFGWGCNGIWLASTSATADILVYNNLVYDVAAYGYGGFGSSDNGYGMIITAGGGYQVYFNSINLTTSQTALTGYPAAMNISSAVTTTGGIDLRNNIFANNQTLGTERYAIYCGAASTVFSHIDHNDYYATGANLGYTGGSNKVDLAAWQAATGQDAHSVAADPLYVSTTDLQLQTGSPAIGRGTAIGLVDDDYAGTPRHMFKPTIGAYEYAPLNFYMWTGLTDDDWNTGTNWSPNGVPGQTDDAGVPDDPASDPDVFPVVPSGTFSVDELYVGPGATIDVPNGATLNVKNLNP